MPRLPRTLLLVLIGMLSACGGEAVSDQEVAVRDSAGVTIVEHAVEDEPLDWRFEEVVAIGRSDDDPVLFGELAPHQVSADSAGQLYLLDEAGHRVAVFDTTGTMQRTYGRQGEGPGELSVPIALSVAADGTVGVFDHARSGLVRWDADGEALDPLALPSSFWGPKVSGTEDEVLFTALADPEGGTSEQVLVRYRDDGEAQPLLELTQPSEHPAEFPSCGFGGLPVVPLFAPELVWAAGEGVVAANAGPEYRIDLFAGDEHVRSVRRDRPPQPATRQLALQEAGDGMVLEYPQRCEVPPEEVVEARGFAEVVPALEQLAVDPAGRIWAGRRSVGEEPAPTDVFDAEGRYLGTLPPGTPFPAAFLGPDLMVSVAEAEVPHAAVYRIAE